MTKQKKTFVDRLKNMGPAAIVTSAFIGPGTITTTTLAGTDFKYQLLWAAVFSGIALVTLMQMTSRVSIISQRDITEASILSLGNGKRTRQFITGLVIVVLIATAFGLEAGNVIGGSAGLRDLFGLPQWAAALILGGAAFYAVVIGTAKTLETLMSVFVSVMGVIFVLTMFLVRPDWGAVFSGMFIPSLPEGSVVNVIALIGTTLIGINLLIQSVSTVDKWDKPEHLEDATFDTYFNGGIGILITLALVITSGTVLHGVGTSVDSPIVFSQMLEPVLGSYARYIGDIGIASAGLSSAIATPLIMKEVFAHTFNWDSNDIKARIAGGSAVVFGTILAMLDVRPVPVIVFASALSGIFLPVIATLLLISANNEELMGEYKNNWIQNLLGGFATLVTILLGVNSLWNFIQNFM